jgi:hypothetical protein
MTIEIITIIVLFFFLLVSIYYNYKFAIVILKIEDSIEYSLDILDEKYARFQKILDTPLFYDSPQVRQVITDISETRDQILKIANELTEVDSAKEEKD